MSVNVNLVISDDSKFCFEKTILVQDEKKGLIDVISQSAKEVLEEYKYTLKREEELKYIDYLIDFSPSFIFEKYYYNNHRLIYDGYFPYIIKDGIYKWNVPIRDVTVEEFLLTHSLMKEGEIFARVGYYGGGRGDEPFSTIITWIPFIYKIISVPVTISEFLKITKLVFQFFKGENNDVASWFDVSEMLADKDRWNANELRASLNYINETLLDLLMKQNGFIKHGECFCRAENKRVGLTKEQSYDYVIVNDLESKVWGVKSGYGELGDFANDLHFVNKILTSIVCQLDYLNSDLKELVLVLVDSFIRMNHLLLKNGDCFRFIEINEKMMDSDIIDDEVIERLDLRIQDFKSYLIYIEDYVYMLLEKNE